jgi:hypothetical protein
MAMLLELLSSFVFPARKLGRLNTVNGGLLAHVLLHFVITLLLGEVVAPQTFDNVVIPYSDSGPRRRVILGPLGVITPRILKSELVIRDHWRNAFARLPFSENRKGVNLAQGLILM